MFTWGIRELPPQHCPIRTYADDVLLKRAYLQARNFATMSDTNVCCVAFVVSPHLLFKKKRKEKKDLPFREDDTITRI